MFSEKKAREDSYSRHLSKEDKYRLYESMTYKKYGKGDALCLYGEAGDKCWFLLQGSVDILVPHEEAHVFDSMWEVYAYLISEWDDIYERQDPDSRQATEVINLFGIDLMRTQKLKNHLELADFLNYFVGHDPAEWTVDGFVVPNVDRVLKKRELVKRIYTALMSEGDRFSKQGGSYVVKRQTHIESQYRVRLKLYQHVNTLHTGETFGEQSLNSPQIGKRNASCVVASPWALTAILKKKDYEKSFQEGERLKIERKVATIQRFELFKNVNKRRLRDHYRSFFDRTTGAPKVAMRNSYLYRKGDKVDGIYCILSGQVKRIKEMWALATRDEDGHGHEHAREDKKHQKNVFFREMKKSMAKQIVLTILQQHEIIGLEEIIRRQSVRQHSMQVSSEQVEYLFLKLKVFREKFYDSNARIRHMLCEKLDIQETFHVDLEHRKTQFHSHINEGGGAPAAEPSQKVPSAPPVPVKSSPARNSVQAESKKAFIHEVLTKKAANKATRATFLLGEDEGPPADAAPQAEKTLQQRASLMVIKKQIEEEIERRDPDSNRIMVLSKEHRNAKAAQMKQQSKVENVFKSKHLSSQSKAGKVQEATLCRRFNAIHESNQGERIKKEPDKLSIHDITQRLGKEASSITNHWRQERLDEERLGLILESLTKDRRKQQSLRVFASKLPAFLEFLKSQSDEFIAKLNLPCFEGSLICNTDPAAAGDPENHAAKSVAASLPLSMRKSVSSNIKVMQKKFSIKPMSAHNTASKDRRTSKADGVRRHLLTPLRSNRAESAVSASHGFTSTDNFTSELTRTVTNSRLRHRVLSDHRLNSRNKSPGNSVSKRQTTSRKRKTTAKFTMTEEGPDLMKVFFEWFSYYQSYLSRKKTEAYKRREVDVSQQGNQGDHNTTMEVSGVLANDTMSPNITIQRAASVFTPRPAELSRNFYSRDLISPPAGSQINLDLKRNFSLPQDLSPERQGAAYQSSILHSNGEQGPSQPGSVKGALKAGSQNFLSQSSINLHGNIAASYRHITKINQQSKWLRNGACRPNLINLNPANFSDAIPEEPNRGSVVESSRTQSKRHRRNFPSTALRSTEPRQEELTTSSDFSKDHSGQVHVIDQRHVETQNDMRTLTIDSKDPEMQDATQELQQQQQQQPAYLLPRSPYDGVDIFRDLPPTNKSVSQDNTIPEQPEVNLAIMESGKSRQAAERESMASCDHNAKQGGQVVKLWHERFARHRDPQRLLMEEQMPSQDDDDVFYVGSHMTEINQQPSHIRISNIESMDDQVVVGFIGDDGRPDVDLVRPESISATKLKGQDQSGISSTQFQTESVTKAGTEMRAASQADYAQQVQAFSSGKQLSRKFTNSVPKLSEKLAPVFENQRQPSRVASQLTNIKSLRSIEVNGGPWTDPKATWVSPLQTRKCVDKHLKKSHAVTRSTATADQEIQPGMLSSTSNPMTASSKRPNAAHRKLISSNKKLVQKQKAHLSRNQPGELAISGTKSTHDPKYKLTAIRGFVPTTKVLNTKRSYQVMESARHFNYASAHKALSSQNGLAHLRSESALQSLNNDMGCQLDSITMPTDTKLRVELRHSVKVPIDTPAPITTICPAPSLLAHSSTRSILSTRAAVRPQVLPSAKKLRKAPAALVLPKSTSEYQNFTDKEIQDLQLNVKVLGTVNGPVEQPILIGAHSKNSQGVYASRYTSAQSLGPNHYAKEVVAIKPKRSLVPLSRNLGARQSTQSMQIGPVATKFQTIEPGVHPPADLDSKGYFNAKARQF